MTVKDMEISDENKIREIYFNGLCYEFGKEGFERDLRKAIECYRITAEAGLPNAQRSLASCYERGVGVERDIAESIRLYTLAYRQGNIDAEFSLGFLYLSEAAKKGQQSVYGKQLLMSAADKGSIFAQQLCGEAFRFGVIEFDNLTIFGFEIDYSKATKYYQMAHEQGNRNAWLALGLMYQDGGYGINRSYYKAVDWYAEGVQFDESLASESILALAYQLDEGLNGVPVDYEMALYCWYKLSRLEGKFAAYSKQQIAAYMLNGRGCPQDVSQSLKIYKELAESGFADAQLMLAFLFCGDDRGVKEDLSKSIYWVQRCLESTITTKTSIGPEVEIIEEIHSNALDLLDNLKKLLDLIGLEE